MPGTSRSLRCSRHCSFARHASTGQPQFYAEVVSDPPLVLVSEAICGDIRRWHEHRNPRTEGQPERLHPASRSGGVEAAERIAVTVHGRVVAEFVPPGAAGRRADEGRWDELMATGISMRRRKLVAIRALALHPPAARNGRSTDRRRSWRRHQLLRCATSATFGFMSRIVTQRELRDDSAAVLREVQAGHTVTVTRNGTPIAELRPVPRRRFVPRAVIAEAARRAPRVDRARLRADLDAVVDPFEP